MVEAGMKFPPPAAPVVGGGILGGSGPPIAATLLAPRGLVLLFEPAIRLSARD